jgi:hypothetical protein
MSPPGPGFQERSLSLYRLVRSEVCWSTEGERTTEGRNDRKEDTTIETKKKNANGKTREKGTEEKIIA